MHCPHCNKSLSGVNVEGEHRVRLGILLCDPTNGRIHGPCPKCKGDVTVATGSTLSKALDGNAPIRLGLRVTKLTPPDPTQ